MLALKAVQQMPKCVRVEWEDGLKATFNYLWLRDSCSRRPSLVHLDLDLKPAGVNCSPEGLNLVWPPCFTTRYPASFLRQNASTALPAGQAAHKTAKPASISSRILHHLAKSSSLAEENKGWIITSSATPIDQRSVTGQVYWDSSAQEPGTVWPWMKEVPRVCAVEPTNPLPARMITIDQSRAYQMMAERHPEEFAFLSRCELEYPLDGFFQARHPICSRTPDGRYYGVFNNAARSSNITAEPLAEFYESLHKLGQIFTELTEIVELSYGERMLVDNTRMLLGMPAQKGRQLLLRCFA